MQNLEWIIVYPMGIQIYNQVSILRITSKVKLDRTILLGFGLKELKITMNITKLEKAGKMAKKLETNATI